MVASRPTTWDDLRRMRQHRWEKVEGYVAAACLDCGLIFDADQWLADIPACPGPGFRLVRRGRHEV